MTRFSGVYAAAVTPFTAQGHIDFDSLERLLHRLGDQGADGALLAGTTGEGLSLSLEERRQLFAFARQAAPSLRLLAGTSALSLEDATSLTAAAFDAGMDAVLILPPFFFRDAPEDGLFAFFSEVIRRAVPGDGAVLLYNNPPVIDVTISSDMIARLVERFPRQVVGMKDSWGSQEYLEENLRRFPGFEILVGSDRLLPYALQRGAAGSITASANAFVPLLMALYTSGGADSSAAEALVMVMNKLKAFPVISALKEVLKLEGVITAANVRPPLLPLNPAQQAQVAQLWAELQTVLTGAEGHL